jgi:cytochrome c biogenesis factor
MAELFTKDYWLLWMIAMALALLIPVRQLIWVLYVRRAERRAEADEATRQRLKKRATATAALICLVFSFFYVNYLFQGQP